MAQNSTIPARYDLRRGIKVWNWYLNNVYGDCVVAAYLHILMVKHLSTASTWKRLLYKLGWQPPSSLFALQTYRDYLATNHQTPGPDVGIDPESFFAWLKATGQITDYGQTDMSAGVDANGLTREDRMHADMIAYNGLLLALSLTNRAYDDFYFNEPWEILPGDVPNPALGHAVALVVYGPQMDGVVTWDRMKSMTRQFVEVCVGAAWWFE